MKNLCYQITMMIFAGMLAALPKATAQQFQWAHGGGAVTTPSETERTEFMCTDPNGNVYALSVVGSSYVTADTFSGYAYGANENFLITSYTCNGQMRWAKLVASTTGNCAPFGIAADSLGNIYVSGACVHTGGGALYIGNDTVISGVAVEYLINTLIQFDTSGHFNWIRFVGNSSLTSAEAELVISNPITTDASNNVHYFCYIKSGVPITTGITSSYGVYDIAYNTAGTLLSAVRLDLDSEWFLQGAVIDPATGKLYVCGEINQGFEGGFLTDTCFAAAFDVNRNLLWQYFAGYGNDDGFEGISLDQSKHLYFAGGAQPHSGETRFVFNGDSTLAPYDVLSVIMKTDTNGKVDWMRSTGCHSSQNGYGGITLLPNNKIACIGTYAGALYFGTDTSDYYYNIDSLTVPSGDGYSPYIAIYDSAGFLQNMQQMYGNGFYNLGSVITSDKVGNLYIGGYVSDSIWADSAGFQSLGSPTDFFVSKYGVPCSCTSMPEAACTYSVSTSSVAFSYTGTTAGEDSVEWSFGDGSTSAAADPSYTYTATGTYLACVTIYTDCGQDSVCNLFNVTCIAPPVASFTVTAGSMGTGAVGFAYTGGTAGVDSVVWSYGDGSGDTGITTTHTYGATGIYTVCVTAYTGCGSNSYCDTVGIYSLGIPSIPAANIQVFPNPATDELNITGIQPGTSYRLLNVTGEWIQQGSLRQGSDVLSLKGYIPGVYELELTGADGGRYEVRVVKE